MLRLLLKGGAELSMYLLLGLAIAILQWAHWPLGEQEMGSGWDSGIFAYCGHALAETHRLYAFCTDNKPPGIFLLNAFASLWSDGGTDWRSVWVMTWAAQVITWIGVARLATRSGAPRDGWVVAGVGAVSIFPVLDGAVTVEIFSLPLQVAVAWSAHRFLASSTRSEWLLALAAGSAVGGLFAMRTNNTAAAILLVGVGVWMLWRKEYARSLIAALSSAVGVALSVGVVLYFSGGREALSGAIEFTLSQGVNYLGTQGENRVTAALSNVMWASSLFVLFVGATMLERLLGSRASLPEALAPLRDTMRKPWPLLLVLWLGIEVAFGTASSRRYPHYAQMLVVPIALLVAEIIGARRTRAVAETDNSTEPSQAWLHTLRASIVTAGCALAVFPNARLQGASFSEGVRERVFARRLADTLANAGARTDGVFLWGAPPVIYVYLGTAAPVRHVAPLTLATPGFTKPEYFTETIACLAGSAPMFVLDAYDRSTVGLRRAPAKIPTLEELPGFDALRVFIARHYEFDRTIVSARTALWKRRTSVAAMRDSSGVQAVDCRPHPLTWRLRATD